MPDMVRTELTDSQCLHKSSIATVSDGQALVLIPISELRAVSLKMFYDEGRPASQMVSQPLGQTAFSPRRAPNMGYTTLRVVNYVHTLFLRRFKPYSIARKQVALLAQELGEQFLYSFWSAISHRY